MKTSLPASIAFVVFMIALILFMCHGGQSITGKYNVSVMPKTEISTEEEKNAMAIFYSAKIQYEFMDDGQLKATTTIGSDTKQTVLSWAMREDSIIIDTQRYKLEPIKVGYVLRGYNIDLLLNKQ